MKSLLLLLFSLIATDSFACMGGQFQIGGRVFTAEGVKDSSKLGGLIEAKDIQENDGLHWLDSNFKIYYIALVKDIKSDAGGIISTLYEIKEKGSHAIKQKDATLEKEAVVYYVRIKSNYLGNGVRTKGFQQTDPSSTVTYDCSGSHQSTEQK